MPPSSRIHDRTLLDLLEALDPQPLSGAAWRASWANRDPLVGSMQGGRWHPSSSFEALYTSLDKNGSLAEMYFHLSRAPVLASSHMRLHRLQVRTRKTLWLPDMATLIRLGVDAAAYGTVQPARCQEIGAAAHFLEFDSLLAPSARWPCQNLMLFLDRLDLDEALVVEESSEINWPAWREHTKKLRT
jgi:RES domain